MAVQLYGRQPLAGYQQGSGRPEDDDGEALDGEGTRPHRFAIRLQKLAALLVSESAFLERGPLSILQLIPDILETHASWMPYQAEVVLKRFLLARYCDFSQSTD